MTTRHLLAWLALATLLGLPARADEGHDHGDAPATATGPALPRFAAASELFELVGVVDGRQLSVYLDRFEDNAPVPNAKVDLDVGGAKVALKEHAPGEFEGTLAAELKDGVTAVTATVSAGNDTDLLAGELHVHENTHDANAHHPGWRVVAGWGIGAALALAALAWGLRRRLAMRGFGGAA